MLSWFRNRRRKAVRKRPFPGEWLSVVEKNIPYYGFLPEADRRELLGHIQVFLAEKQFEGCAGMEITDEVRVTIAAHACVLLLHRKTDYYPLLHSILVYPRMYAARTTRYHGRFIEEEGMDVRSGESWYQGSVVLSWEDVIYETEDMNEGENVVLHEFAHQLDDESGDGDGAPILEDSSEYGEWSRVLGEEYRALVKARDGNRPTFLDPYGAENPSEFFAVATEFFFELPLDFRHFHPRLYDRLRRYYRQDPAALLEAAGVE